MSNIRLNILSLISVGLGFIFIILLGRKLGLGEQTDIYFYSLVVVAFIERFVSIMWSAIKHYYAEFKINNNEYLNKIYIILLNNIILSSSILIFAYFTLSSLINLFDMNTKAYLDIFIFYVLIHSLLQYNKKILNLEHNYSSVYLVDIFVYAVNLVVVIFFLEDNILILAYATIFSSSLVVIWQLRKIFSINSFSYKFEFYEDTFFEEILKNSFKLNISSILYSFKDIAIASIFSAAGSGIYSLFSYANKFIGVISQVVTGPVENVYTAKISHIMAKKDFQETVRIIKSTLIKNSTLFIVAALLTYFLLPTILKLMLTSNINDYEITQIQFLFAILSIYTFFKVIELPYKKVLNLFKFFNFGIYINLIYFVIVACSFVLINNLNLHYSYILFFIIIGQAVKLVLSILKYFNRMKTGEI